MANPPRIRVMISSRCSDIASLDGKQCTFTDVRRRLKKELEQEKLLGSELFDVWINEDAPPAEGTVDAWEKCLEQIRKADIVIALYNGNSGWAKESGEVGICHEELSLALSTAGAKVRIVSCPPLHIGKGPEKERNERFREYVESQARFWGIAKDGNEVIDKAKAALREGVAEMVQLGVREARKGKFTEGQALDWSRLGFEKRREAIESTLRKALAEREGSQIKESCLLVRIGEARILVKSHAIPAALSIAGAREMVGQPFLRDHELVDLLGPSGIGPVHIIGCHRSVTEAQATKQLGFPDAVIVSPAFGVYVADPVQKIQLVFLANCRDETTTRHAVQRVFEWLSQTGEAQQLAERAEGRARIVRTIAAEMPNARPSAKKESRK